MLVFNNTFLFFIALFPRGFSREIRAQSETCLHCEYNLATKNKSLRRIALRAQWKALARRARRGKNAEAFLKISPVPQMAGFRAENEEKLLVCRAQTTRR